MVSVALAAYHGETYIRQQLQSILCQLSVEDEIIVSDDAPGGETQQIVQSFCDSRIRYVSGPGKGLIKNFEYALTLCRGEYIFLCDQDDVWLPGKIDKVSALLADGASLVLHDAVETDADLKPLSSSFFESRGSKPGLMNNILKNSYMGCCMAFRRDLLREVLPFPENIPMHDQWIGLAAEKKGKVVFFNEALIYHRLHGGNMTGAPTSLKQKIEWRVQVLSSLRQIKG